MFMQIEALSYVINIIELIDKIAKWNNINNKTASLFEKDSEIKFFYLLVRKWISILMKYTTILAILLVYINSTYGALLNLASTKFKIYIKVLLHSIIYTIEIKEKNMLD